MLTKRQKDIIERWKASDIYDIFDAYKKPSRNKINVWHRCVDNCYKDDGYSCKIIGHNTSMFSVAYGYKFNGDFYLKYITAYGTEVIPLWLYIE